MGPSLGRRVRQGFWLPPGLSLSEGGQKNGQLGKPGPSRLSAVNYFVPTPGNRPGSAPVIKQPDSNAGLGGGRLPGRSATT